MRERFEVGYTLAECVLVVGILSGLGAIALPALLEGRESARTEAAARHLASRLRQARLEAGRRGVNVALRVESASPPRRYCFDLVADGDHDGVRLADIRSGLDPQLRPKESLPELYGGVEFGIGSGVAPLEPDEPFEDDDPVRIGRSGLLTFGPEGGASGGTLYVLGPSSRQMAVRVLASTGRVRLLAYRPDRRVWVER